VARRLAVLEAMPEAQLAKAKAAGATRQMIKEACSSFGICGRL
jgi:hypothetical protein